MVLYKSTRGGESGVDYEAATLGGYASDGGLYVPEEIPTVSTETLASWSGLSFQQLAVEVLGRFVGHCIGKGELSSIMERSFSGFMDDAVVPVVDAGGYQVAELFHGPTLSFKDFGQQVLCKLLDFFATRKGRPTTLLVSTTGDTGPAAIHGALGSQMLRVVVTYPKGQISDIQRRQMTTVDAPNVAVAAFEGGGDDMDAPIKRLTTDVAFKETYGVTSVNSINIGRVTVQTIHYFWAYFRAIEQLDTLEVGDPLCFAIPTGAMGNVTAGLLAQRMGEQSADENNLVKPRAARHIRAIRIHVQSRLHCAVLPNVQAVRSRNFAVVSTRTTFLTVLCDTENFTKKTWSVAT